MEVHRDVCDCNHTGSSGSMKWAKILWKRSVDVAAFRYTSLVGDGDAAVIESVNAIDPWHGVTVVKEECINHTQGVCMFKGLVRMVRDGNVEVNKGIRQARTLLTKSMGGKGHMKNGRMKKWSSYYRKAIVESCCESCCYC